MVVDLAMYMRYMAVRMLPLTAEPLHDGSRIC